MRTRIRRGSILSDLTRAGSIGEAPATTKPPVTSGVSGVDTPGLGPGAVGDLARSVVQIPFDDSIDATHPLECFFQMPKGVLRIKSAQLWVQQKSFRAYETGSSSGGSTVTSSSGGSVLSSSSGGSSTPTTSGGGAITTSSSGGAHSHTLTGGLLNSDLGSASISSVAGDTDAQGIHNHSDPQGGFTGDAGSHSHNVNSHGHTDAGHRHGYFYFTATDNTGAHTHTVDTTHTHTVTITAHTHTTDTTHTHTVDTSHTHTMTYGIFEQAAAGTLSLNVADNGTTYGPTRTPGVTAITAYEMTPDLTIVPGDKRIRINGTGLCRVQVLVVLDLILQLGAA